MPNDDRLPVTPDAGLLNQIGCYVYQAIITIQAQQPELLSEKYRNLPWNNGRYQSALTAKLTQVLSQTQDWDALVIKLQTFLQSLLIPNSLNSPVLIELFAKIQHLNSQKSALNGSVNPKNINLSQATSETSLQQTGIAVLLLDAENLQLNPETEKFLTTVCTYPVQVKIAFANWRSMGKLDAELHKRGYDLIHVPAGKDHADGKMIAFGSSIHEHYPKAREVLVCSSDTVMTSLCNHLQKNGLTVYRVSKQGNNITVLNNKSDKRQTYSLKDLPEIPSLEKLISQLKALIKAEQKSTNSQWVKLSRVSQLFKNKYQINISEVVSHRLPGKRARDIFIDNSSEFVVHQTLDKSDIYVTVFEMPHIKDEEVITLIKEENTQLVTEKSNSVISTNDTIMLPQNAITINSKEELEKAIIEIIKTMQLQSPSNQLTVAKLGTELRKICGQSASTIVKKLKLSSSFIKFLQSCPTFTLKLVGKEYEVAISDNKPLHLNSININSKEELEKAIIEIIKTMQLQSPSNQLTVAKLGTELRKICGQSINTIVKKLKLGSNFTKFLKSCPKFKLKLVGKEYEVTLA